jgi:hypothetical protein
MRKRQAKTRLRFDLTQARINFTVPSSDSDVKHLERTSPHSRGALAPEFLQEERPSMEEGAQGMPGVCRTGSLAWE